MISPAHAFRVPFGGEYDSSDTTHVQQWSNASCSFCNVAVGGGSEGVIMNRAGTEGIGRPSKDPASETSPVVSQMNKW